MRRLGARIPPPPGRRWTQAVADALVGKPARLDVGPFGGVVGTVVEAKVVGDDPDDWGGHGLWVVVETPE